ncbi:MAG: hypothetical protein LBT58_04915 [Endomicrobium sp.]|jgi:hypothetical protein|nr:hypothetical protein [Endomicrobium sp.]
MNWSKIKFFKFKGETHEYFINDVRVPSVTEIVSKKIDVKSELLTETSLYGRKTHSDMCDFFLMVNNRGKKWVKSAISEIDRKGYEFQHLLSRNLFIKI